MTTQANISEAINHFRAQVLSYTQELSLAREPELPALEYVTAIRAIVPKHTFFTREEDEKKLAAEDEYRHSKDRRAEVERLRDEAADMAMGFKPADVGEFEQAGEFVITEGGVEGSLVYAASATLRDALAHLPRGRERIRRERVAATR